MRRMFMLNLIVVVFASNSSARSDSALQERLRTFESNIEAAIEAGDFVGVSIAISHGDFYYVNGFGMADLENDVLATGESAYRLASVTKAMTAVGVLNLVEDGVIDLDDEVQTYVPYFPQKKWPITIRHLLGHTSGISHYKNYSEEAQHMKRLSTEEAIAIFADWDLLFEPGERMSYTTYGYNLLGAVIEGASGQPFGEYMTEHVWQPLGMNNTRLDSPYEIIPNRVAGYMMYEGQLLNSVPVDLSMKYAGGGTRSTVGDMVKFAQGISDGLILENETIDSMWTPHITRDGHFTGYGHGWGISNFNGRFLVMHSGSQEETQTILAHLPGADLTIAVASNLEDSNPREIAFAAYEAVTGEPIDGPSPYVGGPYGDALYTALRWCFNDGLTHFDYFGKLFTTDNEQLAEAFAYVSQFARLEDTGIEIDSAMTLTAEGRHPVTGVPFGTVGSYMAAQLYEQKGEHLMTDIRPRGVLAFADAYVKLTEESPTIPPTAQLSPECANITQDWADAWAEYRDAGLLAYEITVQDTPAALHNRLMPKLEGKTIRPDYSEALYDAVGDALFGPYSRSHARGFVELGLELYPKSDRALATAGLFHLFAEESDKAMPYLTRSIELNPNGAANAGELNRIAYQLAGHGKYDLSIAILAAAMKLHPDNANLRDSMGEMHLNKGAIAAAKSWYQKALAMDPDFENAKRMLEEIEKRQNMVSPASDKE